MKNVVICIVVKATLIAIACFASATLGALSASCPPLAVVAVMFPGLAACWIGNR